MVFTGQHELGEDAELADDDVVGRGIDKEGDADDDVVGRGIDKEGEDAADVAPGAVIALQNGHAVGVLDLVVDAVAECREIGDALVNGGKGGLERKREGGGVDEGGLERKREGGGVDEGALVLVDLDGGVGDAAGGLLLFAFGAPLLFGANPVGFEGVPVARFRIDALVEVSEFPDRLGEHSEGTEFEHFGMGAFDDEQGGDQAADGGNENQQQDLTFQTECAHWGGGT